MAGAAGQHGIGAVAERGEGQRGRAHDRDLGYVVARRVEELREEGTEEQQRLGVAERYQRALQEEAPRGALVGALPSRSAPAERNIFQPSQIR